MKQIYKEAMHKRHAGDDKQSPACLLWLQFSLRPNCNKLCTETAKNAVSRRQTRDFREKQRKHLAEYI
ncbi:hypothetical protein CLOSYM_04948, partial [[Clostridium] symbiosum ATCC 14940]